ncbi:ionotropic receptor 75a-like [Rhynchophorus ferrugineus]|uniref:ionotropic receptor 75a-like n=1 Tax=Rhynchophorus ferrugineus TaxID=354439 RepID=UPI003FCE369F
MSHVRVTNLEYGCAAQCSTNVTTQRKYVMGFVNEFLEKIDSPSRLINFVCNKKKTVNLYKKYQARHFQAASVYDRKSIPKDFLHLENVVYTINLKCSNTDDILTEASENDLFTKRNVWLLFGEISDIEKSSRFYSYYTNVYLIDVTPKTIYISKVYKITSSSKRYTKLLIAKWHETESRLDIDQRKLEKKLLNFHGEPIRVSYAVSNDSIQNLGTYRNRGIDYSPKTIYLLMNQLTSLYNATHVPIIREYWGDFDGTTGNFTQPGMFADLQYGLADIAGNTAVMSNIRLKYFRYIPSSGKLNGAILVWTFRAPPSSYRENVWLMPFEQRIWIVLSIFSLIIYTLLVLTDYIENWMYRADKQQGNISWYKAFELLLTTATQRGSVFVFNSISGKILCLTLFTSNMLLYTAYTAKLLLAFQSSLDDINDFKMLLNTGMRLGAENTAYNLFYFTTTNDRVDENIRALIYKTKIKGHEKMFWLNAEDGIRTVRDGKFAFHLSSNTAYDIINREFDEVTKRSIRFINSIIFYNNYLCIPKQSPLKDVLTIGLLRLQETGVINREQILFFFPKPIPDYTKPIFFSMDISDTKFIFSVLIIGFLLCLAIFFIEIVTFKVNNYRVDVNA